MKKINLDERYFPEEELGAIDTPYQQLADVLLETFSFESVFDAGCRNGKLIKALHAKNKDISVRGCDYFQWAVDDSDVSVKSFLNQWDLRDDISLASWFSEVKKTDVVTCFEVAEHIDPDFSEIFLENLKHLTGKYLILTWSDSGGENHREVDTHLQHLNPLTKEKVVEKVSKHFTLDEEMTQTVTQLSFTKPNFYDYWRKSLTVWKPLG